MNESKHTPGPWVARVDGPFVCGGDSTVVEAITEDGRYVRREIATLLVDTGDGDEGALTFAEDIANAWLIAAAPELLEACQAFAAWDEDLSASEANSATLRRTVAAAIAKATGGQS